MLSPLAPRHSLGGFTLIEIMIVLIILSAMTTLAAFSLEGMQNREAEQAVRRLERALQVAAETAEIRGAPIAAEFQVQSYRFSILNTRGEWELLFAPKALMVHEWHSEMSVTQLSVNGLVSPPPYRLVFGSDAPEFRLELSTVNGPRVIKGNMSGTVEMEIATELDTEAEGLGSEETERP